jgi:hypothetical protein
MLKTERKKTVLPSGSLWRIFPCGRTPRWKTNRSDYNLEKPSHVVFFNEFPCSWNNLDL